MELDVNHTAQDMRRHIVAADPPSPPAAAAVPQVLKMPLRQVHDQAPLLRQPNPGPGTRVPQFEAHRRGPTSFLLGRHSGSDVVGGLLLRLLVLLLLRLLLYRVQIDAHSLRDQRE